MQQCRGKSSMPTKIQRNVSSQNYFTFILLQELQYESVKRRLSALKAVIMLILLNINQEFNF